MTLFLLYLWLKLDTFSTISIISAIALFVGPGVLWFYNADASTDGFRAETSKAVFRAAADKWRLLFRKTVWFSFFFAFVAVVIPTQRQGAYLIAGYAGLKLAETPEMSKLAELVRLKVGNYLDDELKSAQAEAQAAIASAVSK
jgi:hypothetical protein